MTSAIEMVTLHLSAVLSIIYKLTGHFTMHHISVLSLCFPRNRCYEFTHAHEN
jgi:hypothetical protein